MISDMIFFLYPSFPLSLVFNFRIKWFVCVSRVNLPNRWYNLFVPLLIHELSQDSIFYCNFRCFIDTHTYQIHYFVCTINNIVNYTNISALNRYLFFVQNIVKYFYCFSSFSLFFNFYYLYIARKFFLASLYYNCINRRTIN